MDARNSAGIVTFGDALLTTGDLDPVYTAVHSAKLDHNKLLRLCLGYWCFYHLGLAAKLAEAKSTKAYWDLFEAAVWNTSNLDGTKPFPRGAERRHFRGANALKAYQHLRSLYRTPEGAAVGIVGTGPRVGPRDAIAFSTVSAAVQTHVGFGPWIAFKIADMAERVLGYPVDFSGCELGIYKDPRQGAAVAFLEWRPEHSWHTNIYKAPLWDYMIPDDQLSDTVAHYTKVFGKHKAPPTGDRKVNVQEVETIFCKYKSHLKGHYPVGKDTDEIRHGLTGWGDLAEQLSAGLTDTWDRVLTWRTKHGTR
jgi:hypothetical protein